MIKLLGTAMIVLGSGSAGFGFARAVRAQLRQLNALLAALEDNSMMDDVDAIHLGDGSTLAMDYLDRFTVEMPYGAENYGRLMQILVIAVSQLETNQTGTIRLNPDGEYQARFMPGQRWEG